MKIIVRTFAGFEEILAKEIFQITNLKAEIGKRAVYLDGNLETIYSINLWCRLALDVLVELHHYKASNEDELYNGAYEFIWDNEFSIHETFSITSVVNSPFFNHSKYASLKIKDAIVDQFNKKIGKRPSVDRENPDHKFLVRISHDKVNLLWNTSGDSLFKRGYRTMRGKAPLNEVLAAGILNFSGWDLKRPLIDPICGSGTFLCEALMLARNIPPTIKRKSFGFMNHKDYDHGLWEKLKAKSLEKINNKQPTIMGFDNFYEMIIASRTNINNVLTNNNCKITFKDFFDLEPPIENPMLILNPPYNVRIAQEKNHIFYEEIGSRLKHTWSGSDAWILSGDLESLKYIGLRPIKRIKLFNGQIETKLVHIPLYKGSKKDKYS